MNVLGIAVVEAGFGLCLLGALLGGALTVKDRWKSEDN
jgi:hypothetical protein